MDKRSIKKIKTQLDSDVLLELGKRKQYVGETYSDVLRRILGMKK